MYYHPTTFEYLRPTDKQLESMERVRKAAKSFCDILDIEIPDGADKEFIFRELRTIKLWSLVAISRDKDGTPRVEMK